MRLTNSLSKSRLRRLLAPICALAGILAMAPTIAFAPAASRLEAVGLRCDSAVDPLGVDSAPPRLSWKLQGEGRGLRQRAWQVLAAAARAALDTSRGDIWDSGRVESDAQLHIPYRGRPLRPAEQVFWKVRVWDGEGRPSSWSAPATWTMGLTDSSGWSARWITHPGLLKWVRSHIGYRSEDTPDPGTAKWIQLDLGAPRTIDTVRFHALRHTVEERTGFPQRFKVQIASDPGLRDAAVVADYTEREAPSGQPDSIEIPVRGAAARYIRLTATRLRVSEGRACLAFSQVEVMSGGRNIAVGAVVSASDSREGGPWKAASVVDGLGIPGANPLANGTLLLRREFPVRPGLRRALAFVCGLGQYEMTLNGTRVGKQLLTPGWTDYTKACLYDTHDITVLVRPGANAGGLVLAGGMYNVQDGGGRHEKFIGPFRPLSAIGRILLEYADGTLETITTDERWQAAPGPITYSHVYGGEEYDSRLEPHGWDQPGFDSSVWTPAVATVGPGGVLRGSSHAAPPLGAIEVLKPVAKTTVRQGVEVYDLGQNAAMIPRVALKGPAGSVVRIIPAELIRADGTVDRGSCGHGGAPAWWQYTLSGSPAAAAHGEIWCPKFFYHGSRYLQVERFPPPGGGALPEVESVEGVVVHTTSEPAGEFACSSDLFNRIRLLIRWAQRSNLVSVITDCPHRERLGWLEQYHLNGPSLRYEFDLGRLYGKTFGDMADAQLEDGLVPDIAPEYVVFSGGFRDSPEWGSAIILAAWQQYVWTGDPSPLRRHYDVMRRYLDYLSSRAANHIVSHGLGDWYDIGPGKPGRAQVTPVALTATAIYYEDALAMAKIARLLEKPADAAAFEKLAGEIRAAFNRAFFKPAESRYATGSQTANAMPYVLDLVEAQHASGLMDAIVSDIRARGNALTSGDVGYRYLLRALSKGGRSDVIFEMNHQSEKPGYGYQLAHGATSLTEAWDTNRHSSQNHFMLGHIMEWFYADLAGLAPDPAAPGFGNVLVRPQPVAGIEWAKASHNSPRGRIGVAWRKERGRFTLDVELPPNTTATVWMPAASAEAVTEGERPVSKSAGVRLLRTEYGRVVMDVASGRYSFFAAEKSAAQRGAGD